MISLRSIVVPGIMVIGAVYCIVALIRFYSDVLAGWSI
mgnify:CR=1 FL=1|jgi:hypothetical protein